MKLMGLLLLFLAIVMLGAAYVSRLRERVRLLKAFKLMMLSIKRKLSVSRPCFSELFADNADTETLPFTSVIAERMKNGDAPENAVGAAFSEACALRLLKRGERVFLSETLISLSLGDLSESLGMLGNACEELDSYIIGAEEDERKNAKPVLSAAVYIAMTAVILLW